MRVSMVWDCPRFCPFFGHECLVGAQTIDNISTGCELVVHLDHQVDQVLDILHFLKSSAKPGAGVNGSSACKGNDDTVGVHVKVLNSS